MNNLPEYIVAVSVSHSEVFLRQQTMSLSCLATVQNCIDEECYDKGLVMMPVHCAIRYALTS